MATDKNTPQSTIETAQSKYGSSTADFKKAAPVSAAQPDIQYTNQLAEFVVKSSFDTLPKHLVDHLRRLLLDNIGNSSYAAGHVESSPSFRAAVIRLNPEGGEFTVVGDSRTYSYLFAALLNGAHAHSMDADDTSIQMVGHPGAAAIAVGFAESERTDIQARAFFEALAVGYEVECRVGEALGIAAYSRGFHVTGVAGIFGAIATLAKLRGYTAQQVANAWGLALSKAAGSMQYLENGSWNKRLHPGFAAHDALIVTALTEAGTIGATSAFEGQYGLLHAYSPSPHAEDLTQNLGSDWLTLRTGIKPYPCCRLAHASIDLAIKLRDQVPEAERPGATLTMEINAVANQIVGGDEVFKRAPRSTVDAQFSLYFTTAAGWIDGTVNWDTYKKLKDETLLGVTKRMVLKENKDLPDGAAKLTVAAGSNNLTDREDTPKGEPSNWMGDDALKAKFMNEAGQAYGEDRATQIFDAVLGLQPDDSMVELIHMTRTHTK